MTYSIFNVSNRRVCRFKKAMNAKILEIKGGSIRFQHFQETVLFGRIDSTALLYQKAVLGFLVKQQLLVNMSGLIS